MQQHRLLDLRADGIAWVQRGHWLLEDHADLVATNLADLTAIAITLEQIDRRLGAIFLEQNLAGYHLARAVEPAVKSTAR